MNILLDTNVILDVLLNRLPWVMEAQVIWQACDQGRVSDFVPASALTDIFYIARRAAGLPAALAAVQICLDAFQICPVDRRTLEDAVALPGSDFENNVQLACAITARLNAIVTRDPRGFETTAIPVTMPADFLVQLSA